MHKKIMLRGQMVKPTWCYFEREMKVELVVLTFASVWRT